MALKRRSRAQLSLRQEGLTLLVAAVILAVLLGAFTLFTYRSALDTLDEVVHRPSLAREVLSAEHQRATRLSWVVLPVGTALVLLVTLFVRHWIEPMERMLDRAHDLALDESEGTEIEFLVETFEKATAALLQERAAGEGSSAEIEAIERTLGPSLDSGVLLCDHEGTVLSINEAGTAILGVEAPTDRTTDIDTLLAPHPELSEMLQTAVREQSGLRRRELILASPEGERTLGLTSHLLRRDDGEIRGYLMLFVDLTEARRTAEDERLTESLAQLAELVAGLAHELRNSLAALKGYLTLVERDRTGESISDYLQEIRRESDHLQRVLDDFLSFARPGSDRPEDIPIDRLLARIATGPGLDPPGVRVEEEGPGRVVRGDPQLLERALRNLVLNAVEASRREGAVDPVRVSVRAGAEGIEVVVADRGAGLDEDEVRRAFRPFVTARPDGVGLGLPVAQRIVALHGGKLRLSRRPGGGTEAVVHLPPDKIVT